MGALLLVAVIGVFDAVEGAWFFRLRLVLVFAWCMKEFVMEEVDEATEDGVFSRLLEDDRFLKGLLS